ncbi:MAG: rhomboid family intramembrane serine protease [Deltaproteobacteria bacterium]|nr:rhomboid family intramembrane serine protease [Deltaproteobacteria bacterium]
MIPIGDEPNLRGTPVVTYILIALNVAIFVLISVPLSLQRADAGDPAVRDYLRLVAQSGVSIRALLESLSAYDLFVFKHGFRPGAPNLVDLLTAMFLHANWMHLAGNMLFLWIFGDNVELHVGRGPYIAIYLLTGIAATALFALFSLGSQLPLVGASGAISGVLGCYFLWFPRNSVRILVWFFLFVNVVRVPARWVLGFYLVVENLLPFVFVASGSSVAYGAHIGGFLGGLGCAALVNRWQAREGVVRRVSRPPPGKVVAAEGAPASVPEAFAAAAERGDWSRALQIYVAMPVPERLALRPDLVIELADSLVTGGELEAALAVLQRFIATHPKSALLPRAHLRAALIHLKRERLPASHQHFLTVLDLEADADEVDAARAGLAEVQRRMRARQRLRFD